MVLPAVILAVGGVAIWIDTRAHRIPNLLIAAAFAVACAWQVAAFGAMGLAWALAGALIGLAFLLPIHLKGAMGAGDVKLLAAFGALLGPRAALIAGALTLVAGGGMGLAVFAWQCRESTPVAEAVAALATRIPYAAAIVAGALGAALYVH